MSVIAANGRHEDDLIAEAQRAGGMVDIVSLLDHARGILGDPKCGFGVYVYAPVNALVDLLEGALNADPGAFPTRVQLKTSR